MTLQINQLLKNKIMRAAYLCVGLMLSNVSSAALVDLADAPLANSTTSLVLPNLMYILDNSGSMADDSMPDTSNSTIASLFRNSAYNTIYYNPATRYLPPANFTTTGINTTTYQSQNGAADANGASSAAKPNWIRVKRDAYGILSSSRDDLTNDANFFTAIPGEYCTREDLKTCNTQNAPSVAFPIPAPVRWCTSTALALQATSPNWTAAAGCQASNVGSFNRLRTPSQVVSTITFSLAGTRTITNITVSGQRIMSAATTGTGGNNNAAQTATNINACTPGIVGLCEVAGYRATAAANVLTIYAPVVTTVTPTVTYVNTVNPNIAPSPTAFAKLANPLIAGTNNVPGVTVPTIINATTANYAYPGTTAKAIARTDCAGTTCTYVEEMTNYANWYSYYRTRMQMMKTSTSRAFIDIDTRYRVGFITINKANSNYLPIARFDDTQKGNWYTRLFNANPDGVTPLREALTTTGRIYAGRGASAVGNNADPVQYSCQQNFTLLTTDGYWNQDPGGLQIDGTTAIGNHDGGTTPRPMLEGVSPTFTASNTLADAAMYYYNTDLRNPSLANCTGSAGVDVCTDNVFTSSTDTNTKQHMTTFTLGLGVDGILNFTSDYKTQTAGDFADLRTLNSAGWPVPVQNTPSAVDDLWHAAVNGRGTYFSAKNPTQLSSSLSEALSSITSKVAAGAAAATSTLNPVSGDNFAYVASYTTVKWTGNIEGRTVDTTTGEVSNDATWCVENITAGTCATPLVSDTTGDSINYFCVTPGRTAATCPSPGILEGTNCKVEMASACTGTMGDRVTASSDNRRILMQSPTGSLVPFNLSNIAAAGRGANFQTSFLASNLSQWTDLTTTQQTNLTSDRLVNFLRGQKGYEDGASNVVDNRLFRFREATIGDFIESTPAFNGVPKATYTDPGYGGATVPGTFAYAQAQRDGTIYVGSNDGMLHAFDADDGVERWAYVPKMVMANMWKLADKNYANLHTNYVNGDPIINDVCVANCDLASATWKTILVGGLNGGGTGYYALDITDPENPVSLWEFDASDDADLGFTFGNPIITKKADGKWVVLVTSGYNNISGTATTQGKGFLYVLDVNADIANPGRAKVLTKFNTGEGNATTPSGLAKIRAYVSDAQKNNEAEFIYGGDLLGNLWRFDINSPQSTSNPFKLAKLLGPTSIAQPITVKPELSEVNGKRLIFVGTGKYLESGDLSNTVRQTLYAITDNNETVTLNNPRTSSSMVNQTITNNGATRSVTNNPVDYASKRGWYIDLPDTGERQNVPSQLVLGTLLVPTIVPSNTVCSPGGYGWLNFLNFRTGAIITTNVVASRTNAPIVGINVLYINGNPKVSINTTNDVTPKPPPTQPEFGYTTSGFQDRRVIWRELIEEQQ